MVEHWDHCQHWFFASLVGVVKIAVVEVEVVASEWLLLLLLVAVAIVVVVDEQQQ